VDIDDHDTHMLSCFTADPSGSILYGKKGCFFILMVETAYGTVRGNLMVGSIGISTKTSCWNDGTNCLFKSLGELHSIVGGQTIF